MKRWMWDCEDVQEDLITLQTEYKKLGYNLTKEQCYDVWYMYCDECCANWMYISNVENSVDYIQKVINNEDL